MKAAIFCRGSRQIGLGHVTRSIAIAEELCRRGFDIEFLINDDPVCVRKVEEKGFEFEILRSNGDLPYAIVEAKADFVLSDSNEADRCDILEMIDILPVVNIAVQGAAKWYADASFLHTPYMDSEKPDDARGKIWAGLEYVPLREDFARLHKTQRKRNFGCKILIAMGGGDAMGHTILAIQALKLIRDLTLEVLINVGAAYSDYAFLQNELEFFPHKHMILQDVEDMASLIMECDLAILSMGTTTYEASCLGLPSINICPSRFHANMASIYEDKGMLISLELPEENTVNDLAEKIGILAEREDLREAMSKSARELVDGLGIQRIVNHIVNASRSSWKFHKGGGS